MERIKTLEPPRFSHALHIFLVVQGEKEEEDGRDLGDERRLRGLQNKNGNGDWEVTKWDVSVGVTKVCWKFKGVEKYSTYPPTFSHMLKISKWVKCLAKNQ